MVCRRSAVLQEHGEVATGLGGIILSRWKMEACETRDLVVYGCVSYC